MVETLPQRLLELIQNGENLNVEFKKSRTEITKDVYESVCAFSNRDGGHIFLGVNDNKEIVGIEEDKVDQLRRAFVTTVNNESKISPPLYLAPIEYVIDKKHLLYVRVPALQDVCRCNGRIYDRIHESDIDITTHSDEVYRLYARKRGTYFVNRVTGFGMGILRDDVITRAKKMTRERSGNSVIQAV